MRWLRLLPALALAASLHAEPVLMSYYNGGNGSVLAGASDTDYTHLTVAFLLPNPDNVTQLGFDAIGTSFYGTTISTGIAQAIRSVQASGRKVLLSFGGATVTSEQYATLSANIPALAANIASFVKNPVAEDGLPLHFDGIDIDWEDTLAFSNPAVAGYNGVEFLTDLTIQLRLQLPSGEGWLLTHAPQPPYLSSDPNWSSNGIGGYIPVLNAIADKIDWVNMQYYNNPGFLTAAAAVQNYHDIVNGWSGIPNVPDFAGLPASKLVVGKPALPGDAGSGWLPAQDVANDIIAPLVASYGTEFGGAFSWQFASDPDGAWAATVAGAFPVPEPSAHHLVALALLVFATHRGGRFFLDRIRRSNE